MVLFINGMYKSVKPVPGKSNDHGVVQSHTNVNIYAVTTGSKRSAIKMMGPRFLMKAYSSWFYFLMGWYKSVKSVETQTRVMIMALYSRIRM